MRKIKGTKGLIQAGLLFAVAFAIVFTAYYVLGFATVSLSSNNVVFANATFDTNQTGIDLNLTINLTSVGGGQATDIRTIYVNVSQAGFANITAENLRCPASAGDTFINISPLSGLLACNATGNTTEANKTLTGVVQLRILGLTARSSPGTPQFNVSIQYNTTATTSFISNSSLVTVTLLELQASSSVNDTTSRIDEQRSYNFTVTNNATDPDNFDSIDEIRIDYTLSGFTDTGGANVTCPRIPATTGVAWDLVNSSASNVIRCSKPTAGSALGKGSSTNIVINNWGASAIAQTRRFTIIVNGTNANGTYTVANESAPNVVVNGTINVTGTSRTPATVARNATNVTLMLYNFTTVGEQFNVSIIKLTLSGSAAAADFDGIRLINDTDNDGVLDATDLPVLNASALSSANQYEFVGNLRISDNNTLLLVANISGAATGGRTYRFNLNASSDINSLGGNSGANVTETVVTGQSNQGTIHGTFVVTGFNLVSATNVINTANIPVVYFELNATGEGMNITMFNVTRGGSAADADLVNVRLFNDTNANAAFDSGTDTQLGTAQSTTTNSAYKFTGFQFNVSTSGINRILVVLNISAATGGRTFALGINRTADLNTVGATTGENFTGSTNISFVGAQSGTTTIHGTLAVTGRALNPNTTAISTAGLAVLLLNFTASGEQFNVTQINLTRTGTATDGDGIFNVTLYNDTDRSGTFNAGDLAVVGAIGFNTTTATQYIFRTISYNVTTAGSSLLVVVSTNNSATTGGSTFNVSLNTTGAILAFSASSNVNITGSTNITLTTTNGNITRIFGTLEVTGSDLTPTTANDGQTDVPILNLTFAATGEQMNITQLNISMNNTANADVANVRLYNDTDRSGTVNAGDFLVATATVSGSNAAFGSGTSQLFNVSAGVQKSLIVAYDIAAAATGGNLLDANLSRAGDLLVAGSSSALAITPTGLPINPVGETQIVDLTATATIDFLNTKITATNTYNFTIENTGGDEINSIMIDYTASGFFDIPTETDVLCPRIAGTNWTRTITNATNTINCTSPGGANNLVAAAKANVTVKNFQAGTSAANQTFTVQVRGAAGGFFNATSNGVTVSGFLNVTGANQIASTIVVNSRNVSVIRYNLSASGEQMNVTVIRLTRAGTSRESDIVNVKIFNDTDIDGTYTATTDTTQIGTTQTANTTAAQYVFTGFQWNITTGLNQSIFAVIEVGNTSTAIARTIIFNINATDDVNAVGGTTAVNITENLTGTASTASTIFGNLTITGKSLVNTTVAIGTETSVLQLNFTSLGEQMDISMINISVIGTATEVNLTNVRLMNDTNANGIFDSADTQVGAQLNGTTGSTTFKFTTIAFNVSAGSDKTLFVVVNTTTAVGAAGKTFNLSLATTGEINTFAPSSGVNITEVLTTTTSNQATIGGTLSITGKSLAPATRTINVGGISVLQLNLSATNEGMNISVIKLTRSGSATDSIIFNVSLFNDTDLSGTFNAGDARIGTTQNTTASSKYEFLGINYNITTSAHTLLVVVSTNSTAGNTFNLSLASSGDINSIGATSGGNVTETLTTAESNTTTIHGTTTVTGRTIAPAQKAVNTSGVAVLQLNFTSSGEGMNLSVLNITRTGSVVDGNVFNVSLFNDTDLSGTFNAGDTTIGTVGLNTSTSGQYVFSGLGFNFPAGGKTLFVILTINTSSVAENTTGGRAFNFSLVSTGDYSVIGATSAENLTGSSNITLTSTQSTVATLLHGTLSVLGANQVGTNTAINTRNVSVIRYNFTPSGENIIVSVLNITRSGSATDSDIVNVALYNDTDSSGTFNAGDDRVGAVLNSSSSGVYTFGGLAYNVTSSRVNTLFLAVNTTSGATGGRTFNFTIGATGDVSAVGSNSTVNITATANITRNSVESSTTTIHGTLTVTGTNKASPTAVVDTSNFVVLQLNFSATGEAFNISLINVTVNGSATEANLTNYRLFVDTDATGIFSASSDTQLGAVVSSATGKQVVFTGFQFNVTTGAVNNTLFLVVNTSNAVGTGGTRFTLSLNKTGDMQLVGAGSNRNLTADANVTLTTAESVSTVIHGKLAFAGKVLNADFVEINTGGFAVLQLNITATGETANISLINLTRTGTAADGDIFNVSLFNDTDRSGTFNSGDTSIGTRGVNTTSPSNQYVFTGFQFNVSAGSDKTLFVIVSTNTSSTIGGLTFNLSLVNRGDVQVVGLSSGQNYTASTNITLTTTQANSTKIFGTLALTSSHVANTSAAFGTADLSIMRYNLSAAGESMNISVVRVTRSGSSNETNIINMRLFNDTNLNGVFDPTSDTQIGSALSSTTANQYIFGGISYNITTAAHSLFVVVNVSGDAAGRTFRFNINGTGDINTIGSGSAFNITETNSTTLESSQVVVFGTLTVTGVSLVGGQGPDAPECSQNTKRCAASNEANITVARLNLTATGEQINISVIKLARTGSSGLSDDHIVNVRLVNDTNANGVFDSSDTQLGSAQSVSSSGVYSFTGFQYNVTTSGVSTLFVVLNTTARVGWDPQVYFNLSLNATGDINVVGALSNENITETLTQAHFNTTKITQGGWFNYTTVLSAGWNTLSIPQTGILETTGRNSSNTQTWNISVILDSLGSSYNIVYYNINGTDGGWKSFSRLDPVGSDLKNVSNANDVPYWINMSASNRFEI